MVVSRKVESRIGLRLQRDAIAQGRLGNCFGM